MMELNNRDIRVDLKLIAGMVQTGSRLLDVGCGDGALLEFLVRSKNVDGRGIEISMEGVSACVSQGLSVIQGDADTDLFDYPDQAFDYVVLSQTLQATRSPKEVLENLLRIGQYAIVSFPNFGYWRVRLMLLMNGRMPRTKSLPFEWFDTPNIHFCTIRDFVVLTKELGITIVKSIALNNKGQDQPIGSGFLGANLMGQQAVFLLKKNHSP